MFIYKRFHYFDDDDDYRWKCSGHGNGKVEGKIF
jgi:hypothetical protein